MLTMISRNPSQLSGMRQLISLEASYLSMILFIFMKSDHVMIHSFLLEYRTSFVRGGSSYWAAVPSATVTVTAATNSAVINRSFDRQRSELLTDFIKIFD